MDQAWSVEEEAGRKAQAVDQARLRADREWSGSARGQAWGGEGDDELTQNPGPGTLWASLSR